MVLIQHLVLFHIYFSKTTIVENDTPQTLETVLYIKEFLWRQSNPKISYLFLFIRGRRRLFQVFNFLFGLLHCCRCWQKRRSVSVQRFNGVWNLQTER